MRDFFHPVDALSAPKNYGKTMTVKTSNRVQNVFCV